MHVKCWTRGGLGSGAVCETFTRVRTAGTSSWLGRSIEHIASVSNLVNCARMIVMLVGSFCEASQTIDHIVFVRISDGASVPCTPCRRMSKDGH
jgi:cytidine deaminase